MTVPVLDVRDLHVQLPIGARAVSIVTGVSLQVSAGEAVALVGESGCGKSMTARAIIGLTPPGAVVTGSVSLDGQEVTALPPAARRLLCGGKIGFVFQEPMTALHPTLTIGRQMTDTLRVHLRLGQTAARDRAAELLARVGLPDGRRVLDSHAHQLSGGMRQRVCIAMAISCGPRLVIADEPTTALDVTVQAQVLDLLSSMRTELGLAMLYITHDLEVARAFCDRAVVMYAGDVVETGTAAGLFAGPRHPYTAGLMAAIPAPDERRTRLHAIPGQVPPVGSWPGGCRFMPRCARADDACHTHPALDQRGVGLVRCWHPVGAAP